MEQNKSLSIECLDKNKCFSCRSCEQTCPCNAIKMVANNEGFLYPVVTNNCVNCGLCSKRCPSLHNIYNDTFDQQYFCGYLRNNNDLLKSSSGGVFFGIASKVVDEGGVVFGATYLDGFQVAHVSVTTKNELRHLQGSKYVVSDTLYTYSEAKKYLDNGIFVLFSGTPCQIAGLKGYLVKNYTNLLTIDLICHGVPSQKLFSKYIEWLEKKNKNQIYYYGFRDKEIGGWGLTGKIIIKTKKKTKTKTKIIKSFLDPYYSSFLRGEIYRESCYKCPFANLKRIGDITLGDFWGVNEFYPEIVFNQGVSSIIVNTLKGKEVINRYSDCFTLFENIQVNEICKYNKNLSQQTTRPEIRNSIYENIDKCSSVDFFSRFKETSFFYRVFLMLKYLMPVEIKEMIKRML